MRSLRTFTFAVAVVLALGAASASSALAASEFKAAELPATISGEQTEGNHVITIEDEKKLTCEKATFSGELVVPATTLTVTPSYSGCKFGEESATVKINSCSYVLHSEEELSEDSFEGTMDVSCPESSKIAVSTSLCEFTIGPQSGKGKLEFVDSTEATPPNFKINISLTGLKYNKAKDEGGCPLTGTGEKEGGSYSGHELIKGSRGAESVGVAVLKKVKVKLCQEDPGKAACVNAYPEKVNVEGSNKGNVELSHAGEIITCTTSQLKATTKAEEEDPLNLENYSVTFTGCTLKGANCTNVALATKPAPTAAIHLWGAGNGFIIAAMSILVECPGIKCQFNSPNLSMIFFGANAAEVLVISQSLTKEKITGETGCAGALTWTTAKYPLTSPGKGAVWVSK